MNPIKAFLSGKSFAVVGASDDRSKFGNKVLREYIQHGVEVFPVHPTKKEIEGLKAYPNLTSIPKKVHGVSIITPPMISEKIVLEAIDLGIKHLWLQPGAENTTVIKTADRPGINLIYGGPCILVDWN